MNHLRSFALRGALSVLAATFAASALADDDSPWIYKFENGPGAAAGRTPVGALLSEAGRLYGTTLWSGSQNGGTFYAVSPNADGTWTHASLMDFTQDSGAAAIGFNPAGGVVKGTDGAFYGMTQAGLQGAGGVYRLEVAGTTVRKKLLHAFDTASEGSSPDGELAADARGNLYGILSNAAQPGAAGAVFELEKHGKSYVFHLLHTFGLASGDGRTPGGRLSVDASGKVYGTTKYGGQFGAGTVYRLSSLASGSAITLLHSFKSGQSVYPLGGVTLDASGALAGSTGGSLVDSGSQSQRTAATVFRMTPRGKSWSYADVFREGTGAAAITAPVDVAADGRLTATTTPGLVFQLVPGSAGTYAMQVLGDVSSYDSAVMYGLAYSADGHQIFGTSPLAAEGDDFNTNGGVFAVAR